MRFVLTDTGEGIAEETLPQIFDRFARATSRGEGFGLGLYIVKRFAEALGGSVCVESTRGIGTRFEVTVPCEAPRWLMDEGAHEAARAGSVIEGIANKTAAPPASS